MGLDTHPYKHGNEPWALIKGWKFLEWILPFQEGLYCMGLLKLFR